MSEQLTTFIIPKLEAKKLGLQLFFTGKKCSNGHLDFRYVEGGACRTCRSIAESNRAKQQKLRRKLVREHRSMV